MYQAKESKVVFDPYEYIPAYGEGDIGLNFKDNTLELNIFYDNEETNNVDCLKLSFINTLFFKIESSPGVKGMNIEYDYGDSMSSLIEFSNSNYAKKWEEHFNNLFKLTHYKIFFLNVNKSVEVICEGFQVNNAV